MPNSKQDTSYHDGLPKANRIPIKVDDVITRLAGQQARLSDSIDRRWDGLNARQLARLLTTYGQNASRLGRLLRDRCALYGQPDEERENWMRELDAALDDALQGDEAENRDAAYAASDDEIAFVPPIDIDDVITALADRQERLAQVLDRLWDDPDAEGLEKLLAVYSQNASRVGRLLRDRCTVYGQPRDPFLVDLDRAIDEFWRRVEEEGFTPSASPPHSSPSDS